MLVMSDLCGLFIVSWQSKIFLFTDEKSTRGILFSKILRVNILTKLISK